MYNQPMTQLDPALQALITLQQRANPTTPEGTPTIAAQMLGQAMPQQAQGLVGIINDAQQAIPSMQRNAEQGQVDQIAQQVMQRMQQQQQPPGITGLPAGSMGFREGGIIPETGYAKGGGITLPSVKYGEGFTPAQGIAGVLANAETESPEIAAIRMREAEINQLNKDRPDYLAQNIAALEADKAAREAISESQRKREGFDALMAMALGGAKSGMAGMAEGTQAFNKQLDQRRDAERQANLLDAQLRVKLGEAEHARRTGDLAKNIEIQKEIATIKQQKEQLVGTRYGQDLQAQVTREQIAAHSRDIEKQIAGQLAAAKASSALRGRAQDIQEFKNEFDSRGLKKKYEALAQRETMNDPKAPELRRQLDAEYNGLKQKYGLTTADVGEAPGGAAPASATGAPGAKLKYNPATGKIE